MLKILCKIKLLSLNKLAHIMQKYASIAAKNQTLKNRAKTKIFQCRNRQDFALERRFALRFAGGTILQIVAEKILKIRNILQENETILNGGCHA